MKIVLSEPIAIEKTVLNKLAYELTTAGHEFIAYDTVETDPALLAERVRDADILIIANNPLKGEVIRSALNLKYISVAFTGVDHSLRMAKRRRKKYRLLA